MADFKYQRDTNRFFALGMDLNRPVDGLKELKYTLLKNVRSYQTGRLEPRQGLTLIGTVTGGAVHSIRRLNSPRTGDWLRVIGAGSILSAGKTSFAAVDTGYSGDPLALVPYRPPQDPDPWMYVMDSVRQRKVDIDGTIHQVGMPPPTAPPLVTRQATYHKEIFDPVMSLTGWTNGPTFVATFPETQADVNTSVSTVLYDSGSSGWGLVEPGIMSGINTGGMVNIGTNSYVVYDAISGSDTSTELASVEFLSTGTAQSITFTTITNGMKANSLLENTSRGEFARIVAVVDGPNGNQCAICTLPSLWTVGDTIFIRSSFRVYSSDTITAGLAIQATSLSVYVNVTNDSALPYTGWINSPKFSTPLDLSKITDDISSTPDSYIAISMSLERPDDVENIRVMFGCTDTNDTDEAFNTNYFFKTFTPQDLSGTNEEETVQDVTSYAGLHFGKSVGASVLRIKLAELLPIGSPSLKSIYHVRIEMTVRTPETEKEYPGSRIYFGSIYLAGIPGPDAGVFGMPYIYRYRARCSTTGVVSNWSPPTLEAFDLQGENVLLTAPTQYTLATEADMLDYQRRGGSLPNDWYYVGSITNSDPPEAFTDELTDDVIIANPSEDQIRYQLWPIIGAPTSGTVTSTSGVMVVGTGFSTAWAPRTPIMIDGTWYTIYQVYSETSLQTYENTGYLTNVTWEVQEPLLQGQPMPCFWGPLQETLFACGDRINPQRLYWTNVGDADSTQLSKWIDITTPSEPLMNGVIYNGRAYVWSSERLFQVIVLGEDESGVATSWGYIEIPAGKGLWARWAFTNPQSMPGGVLQFLSKDGIYSTDGGTPSDITADDLRPIFPNEGNLGEAVNTVPAPYMLPGAAAQFRLSVYDDYLYFDYPDNTFAIPLTAEFVDGLNAWADALYSLYIQAGLADSLNHWGDSLILGITFPGFSLSDSLDAWGDSLGVTVV